MKNLAHNFRNEKRTGAWLRIREPFISSMEKGRGKTCIKKIATMVRQIDRYLCVEMQMHREMF